MDSLSSEKLTTNRKLFDWNLDRRKQAQRYGENEFEKSDESKVRALLEYSDYKDSDARIEKNGFSIQPNNTVQVLSFRLQHWWKESNLSQGETLVRTWR